LNCNVLDLRGELEKIANADFAHVDVMDNHFVPNLTWGLPVVEQIVNAKVLPVDAHLMIADADRWAPAYAEAGCASVTFHVEAAGAPIRLAREIRAQGAKAAMALKPTTDIAPYEDILAELDMVLIMTVEPGFGGQPFLTSMLPKIKRTRAAARRQGVELAIQVDGGVSAKTIEACAEAGADVFVAGSAVFRADNASAEVDRLRSLATHVCAAK
ncbi:MAG: ribulose-phosphate 3-epimerase, partial [Bowdeniella nasicola]|nr:ribulose-phosphate 3-epimerase [Bowdeniella nasicola]